MAIDLRLVIRFETGPFAIRPDIGATQNCDRKTRLTNAPDETNLL